MHKFIGMLAHMGCEVHGLAAGGTTTKAATGALAWQLKSRLTRVVHKSRAKQMLTDASTWARIRCRQEQGGQASHMLLGQEHLGETMRDGPISSNATNNPLQILLEDIRRICILV